MNQQVRGDMAGSRLPFVNATWAMRAQRYAALDWMATGIGRNIVPSEITCFRKVAL